MDRAPRSGSGSAHVLCVSRAYCEAAPLLTAGKDRPSPVPFHQRRLPGCLTARHRRRGHPRVRRIDNVGSEQFDVHVGPYPARWSQRAASRPHVPADARSQHRHDFHRHPCCSRLRQQGLPEDPPSFAVASVLQHSRHHHLVSGADDA